MRLGRTFTICFSGFLGAAIIHDIESKRIDLEIILETCFVNESD